MHRRASHKVRPIDAIRKQYAEHYGIRLLSITEEGRVEEKRPGHRLGNPDVLVKARADALRESVRWGEVTTFFLCPGVLSWVLAVVDGDCILGGVIGGEVIAVEDAADVRPAMNYLVDVGCQRKAVADYVDTLPRWPQNRVRQAAEFLYGELYTVSGLTPRLLQRNHEHAQQQRQIAENIHALKDEKERNSPYEGERALMSLIRVGDKPGARRLLNKVLAGIFLNSPRVVMVQAYAIEMMGYLVRVAIENSPVLEGLLDCQRQWVERILQADTFESLCWELREILDVFMDTIYLQGYNRTNRKAQEILDFIGQEYREAITLQAIGDAVDLSSSRVAHLIKEATGKTVTQHIRQMRVREAQKLLLHTDLSYAAIAQTLGFSDQSYFIKQFRALTGTTPAKYRHGTDLRGVPRDESLPGSHARP